MGLEAPLYLWWDMEAYVPSSVHEVDVLSALVFLIHASFYCVVVNPAHAQNLLSRSHSNSSCRKRNVNIKYNHRTPFVRIKK